MNRQALAEVARTRRWDLAILDARLAWRCAPHGLYQSLPTFFFKS